MPEKSMLRMEEIRPADGMKLVEVKNEYSIRCLRRHRLAAARSRRGFDTNCGVIHYRDGASLPLEGGNASGSFREQRISKTPQGAFQRGLPLTAKPIWKSSLFIAHPSVGIRRQLPLKGRPPCAAPCEG